MNDAVLNFCFGIDTFDSLGKAFESINTSNEDIFNTAIIEVG